MRISKQMWFIFALLLISALALVACQPTTIVETVVVTQEVEVEKEVIVTEIVEVVTTVEVPAEPPPEMPTGTLVRAISTLPNSLDMPQAAERQASTTAWQM